MNNEIVAHNDLKIRVEDNFFNSNESLSFNTSLLDKKFSQSFLSLSESLSLN